MGNTRTTRTTARRIAAFLALLGALLMSSGVALIATAGAATAGGHGDDDEDKKVNVCHATDSDTNPYQYLNISKNAVKDNGHLAHRTTPNKIWKTDGTWNGTPHHALDKKPDLIEDFDGHVYDGNVTKSLCDKHGTVDPATASVDWIDPSCENGNDAGVNESGEHVMFSTVTGSADPGTFMKVKAAAIAPYEFTGPGDKHTRFFEHYFDDEEVCTQFDATASVEWVEPSCENQNTPNYLPTGNHVNWEITGGSLTPDEDVEVTASAFPNHAFDNEATKKVFTHHFDKAEICEIVNPPREVTPEEPTFVDPTCDTDPSVTLPQQEVVVDELGRKAAGPVVSTSDANGIHYVATGDLVPGGTVEVDATLIDPETTFFGEGVVHHWSYTFPVPKGCTLVSPPQVTPPTSQTEDTTTTVVTPTVVEAGLAGEVADDLRTEQGLALVLSGMVLLLAAGGLVRQRS